MDAMEVMSLFIPEVDLSSIQDVVTFDINENVVVTRQDFDTIDRFVNFMMNGNWSNYSESFEKEFGVSYENGVLDLGQLKVPFWVMFNMSSVITKRRLNRYLSYVFRDPSYRSSLMARCTFSDFISNSKIKKDITNGNSTLFSALFSN